jgi:hypothetical protein
MPRLSGHFLFIYFWSRSLIYPPLRTKFILFSCAFLFFNISAFPQGYKGNELFSGDENYQFTFFNQFYYDDFSYRFSSNLNKVEYSFGKRFALPSTSVFSLNDSLLLDSLKAVSNIYLVLGTQKNQALQLENLQKIGKSTFLYLNYNSIASLGFLKNSASRNRSFILNIAHESKSYNLNADFLIASNYDAACGGIIDSIIPSNYSKRDLQQLNVNLTNDYLKKKYLDVGFSHNFKLLNSSNGEKKLSLFLNNNYSKYGYLYSGDGFNSFYENIFNDSSSTIDTCGYSWFKNEIGITTKLNSLLISVKAINNDFDLQMLDSVYHFNDWSVDASFSITKNNFNIYGSYSKNLGTNFRGDNEEAKIGLLYKFTNKYLESVEFVSSYSIRNVPFVYQKQFSNHFYWNVLSDTPMVEKMNKINVKVKNNFIISGSITNYEKRVYLNESISPVLSRNQENIIGLQASYNDTIRKFHLIEIAAYNNSNSVLFPVIPFQSFTRVGYMFSLFKNNLKVEAGVSGVYNDAWYATSYSPALDDFYLQTEKKYGGLTVLNVFADFKIKSATLFLKVERVNIGWFKENTFTREGYVAPPRTIRFGFNWPLAN